MRACISPHFVQLLVLLQITTNNTAFATHSSETPVSKSYTAIPAYGSATCITSTRDAGSSSNRRRHLSIADLHGDWLHALEILEALGVVAEGTGNNYIVDLKAPAAPPLAAPTAPVLWTGGDAVMVQTGDVVNRGVDGAKLYTLLFQLQDEAAAAGGEVHMLIGNHELMSMEGDQRYTSQAEMAAFGGAAEHLFAWSREGRIGKEIRARAKAVVVVADVVYVHGGLLPAVLAAYTPGMEGPAAVAELNRRVLKELRAHDAAGLMQKGLGALDGLMWERDLVEQDETWACPALQAVLNALGAARMVVGHCPQFGGEVLPRCGGAILAADTFVSSAYTGDPAASKHNEAALEFYDDSNEIFVVYPRRNPMCVPMATRFGRDEGGDGVEASSSPPSSVAAAAAHVDGQQLTCSQLGWTSIVNNVCGESDDRLGDNGDSSTCNTASFADATNICAAAGARLCTTDEVDSRVTAGTGCGFDTAFTWTSTWCGLGPEGGKFYVSVGSGSGEHKCKHPKKEYAVRCCSDADLSATTALPATTTTTFPHLSDRKNCATLGWQITGNACGESDAGFRQGNGHCFTNKNHPDAERKCLKLGGRMCTQADIEAGVGKATGCGFDSKLVWTSTSCGTNSYIQAKGNGNGETLCAAAKTKGSMRCCSDVALRGGRSYEAKPAGNLEGKQAKVAMLKQKKGESSSRPSSFAPTAAGKLIIAGSALIAAVLIASVASPASSSSSSSPALAGSSDPDITAPSEMEALVR